MQYTRSYHVPKMKKFLLLLLLGGISQVGVAQTAPAKKAAPKTQKAQPAAKKPAAPQAKPVATASEIGRAHV